MKKRAIANLGIVLVSLIIVAGLVFFGNATRTGMIIGKDSGGGWLMPITVLVVCVVAGCAWYFYTKK